MLSVEWLGRVPHRPTWDLQNDLADRRRRREIGDHLLLLEHDPVYTIGRGGDEANLLATPERMAALGAELVRIDRGGDITFHGPGQLVAYPIVELADPLDLRRYVRALETAVIATAARFGVEAARVEGLPGVWVKGAEARRRRRSRPPRRHDPRSGAQCQHRSRVVRRDGRAASPNARSRASNERPAGRSRSVTSPMFSLPS